MGVRREASDGSQVAEQPTVVGGRSGERRDVEEASGEACPDLRPQHRMLSAGAKDDGASYTLIRRARQFLAHIPVPTAPLDWLVAPESGRASLRSRKFSLSWDSTILWRERDPHWTRLSALLAQQPRHRDLTVPDVGTGAASSWLTENAWGKGSGKYTSRPNISRIGIAISYLGSWPYGTDNLDKYLPGLLLQARELESDTPII
ncbi:hypothetical protein M432DRAFT_591296 [Thermoascus aurantiacus ATCC 26904]